MAVAVGVAGLGAVWGRSGEACWTPSLQRQADSANDAAGDGAVDVDLMSRADPSAPRRNIVATVNLECRLDLKTIALHARNAEYNPKVRCGCRLLYEPC